MSKHLNNDSFYYMPSGNKVHPCRLIQRDGTLMWIDFNARNRSGID